MKEIVDAVKNYGIPGILIIVICFFFFHVDKIYELRALFASIFAWCSDKAKKHKIADNIKGHIINANKHLGLDDSIIVNDIKINWVKEETTQSFLDNNQVIIRMNHKSDPRELFVTAVSESVKTGLLPKSRIYINKGVMQAVDITLIRKIIINGYQGALKVFDEKVFVPMLLEDKDFADTLNRLKEIDSNGMMISILLNEYAKVYSKIYPDEPDKCLFAESKELLNYLYNIRCGFNDTEDLIFDRNYFKIDIFLAIKSNTLKKIGFDKYKSLIDKSISNGIETVYIFGLGQKIEIAKKLAKEIENSNPLIANVNTNFYKHKTQENKTIQGVCIEIQTLIDRIETDY